MTKRNVVWLIVRLLGLYFLWNAVTSALLLVTSLQAFDGYAMKQGNSAAVFVQMLIMTVIYAALGLYCVGDGRVFFHVLNRESDG